MKTPIWLIVLQPAMFWFVAWVAWRSILQRDYWRKMYNEAVDCLEREARRQ